MPDPCEREIMTVDIRSRPLRGSYDEMVETLDLYRDLYAELISEYGFRGKCVNPWVEQAVYELRDMLDAIGKRGFDSHGRQVI